MDEIVGERGYLDGRGHPAREVGFEGWLVVVAGHLGFAGYFLHYVGAVLGGEEGLAAVEEAFDGGAPFGVAVRLDGVLARLREREVYVEAGWRRTKLYMFAAPIRNVPTLYVHCNFSATVQLSSICAPS